MTALGRCRSAATSSGLLPCSLSHSASLAGQRRLAGALEAGEHDHGRRRSSRSAAAGSRRRGSSTSSSLTILTTCWAGFSAWLTSSPRARSLTAADELLDHGQRDVGLEQRDPDLARGGVDVGLGEPALAAQVLEGVGEPVGECGEHVWFLGWSVRSAYERRALRRVPGTGHAGTSGRDSADVRSPAGRPSSAVSAARTACAAAAARSSESAPARGLLHVEHVDRLRAERGDVRRARPRRRAGPAPRRPGRPRPGRSAARTSSTVACADASGRTTTVGASSWPAGGASRAPASTRPSTTASSRCRSTRGVEVLARRPPRPRRRSRSCDQARAARTADPLQREHRRPTSASSPTRSGAITVTREPSSTGSTGDRDARRGATSLGHRDLVVGDRRRRGARRRAPPGAA